MASNSEKLTGFFLGKDCLFQQKVVLIEKYIKDNHLKFSETIAYSDSKTDLPLLQWADEAIVVSKNESQAWASSYGFKEIII